MSTPRAFRIALVLALLLCPRPGAAEQCDVVPVLVRIGHGVFLASTQLRCRSVGFSEPVAHLQETREWLALCRELGGTPESCVSGLLDTAPPSYEALVNVVRSQRGAPAAKQAQAVRVTAANALVWRNRLLTNGVVESLEPVKRAAHGHRQRSMDPVTSQRE